MPSVRFLEERGVVIVNCGAPEQTLLDASLAAGLPHYHMCGGLARCSTCRVLVVEGLDSFGPRTAAEGTLAQQRGWPDTIRLACQSRPSGAATVRRVIDDDLDADLSSNEVEGWPVAAERELAVLFCDIAGFTAITEHQLAYDVVHSLNRFFKVLGDPILANGGIINKYLGDGLLALFGIAGGSHAECSLRAVRASLQMLAAAQSLNVYLRAHFGFAFEPRIGLHFGRVLVGQIGHPGKIDLTVIGDAVNTASRIESANKRHGTQLLASHDLVAPVKEALVLGRFFPKTSVRGRRESLDLFEIVGLQQADSSPNVEVPSEAKPDR